MVSFTCFKSLSTIDYRKNFVFIMQLILHTTHQSMNLRKYIRKKLRVGQK